MDGRVGAAAAELQRAPSKPPGAPPTKKISFSFGSKNGVSTRGSDSVVASTPASLHSSVCPVRSSSLTVASGRSKANACATAAAVPSREVLSIFCSNDESGADTHRKATRQVLSFDKFRGWEEKTAENAVDTKGKAPLVIPCLHSLKPPRRGTLRSEQAERTPAGEARGAAASGATAVGTKEEAAKATLSGRQEERVSAGGLAAPVEWTEAALAGRSDSPAGERGARAPPDGKAAAGEGASAEGDFCGDAEARKEEKAKKDTYAVHLPSACGEASAAVGAARRDGVGAAAPEAGQKSGGQITTQQPQQDRKTGSVQFGLIKREAGARSAELRSSASADERGRETQATSAPTILRRTAVGLHAGLGDSPAAAGPGVLAAACVNDADDLAAHALIAEAKNENAAAAAAAWDSAYAAQDAVPILARNAELAALRRRFRERMRLQQQQQRQREQQQSEQTQKEGQHEQSLQQWQCRGRGTAIYTIPDVCDGNSGSKGEKYTWSRAVVDEKNARSCGRTGSCDVAKSSREEAAGGAGGYSGLAAGATASSVVARAATASAPAVGGDSGRNDLLVNGSVSEAEGDSHKQQQMTLSREEAEKELLRQELDLLPDAPQAGSVAYAAVPVSEFGMAMLRGMGYDPAVAAAKTAAVDEEKKSPKKRTYARAGLGSEAEVERLWAEREKKLKEMAMKERKRKLEEMQNSRYYR